MVEKILKYEDSSTISIEIRVIRLISSSTDVATEWIDRMNSQNQSVYVVVSVIKIFHKKEKHILYFLTDELPSSLINYYWKRDFFCTCFTRISKIFSITSDRNMSTSSVKRSPSPVPRVRTFPYKIESPKQFSSVLPRENRVSPQLPNFRSASFRDSVRV